MSSPERKDANLPFSFFPQTGSTAVRPPIRHTVRWFSLLSTPQMFTLLAALLLLPLTAVNLNAQQGSEDYVFHSVTIVAGGYVPGMIAHPTEPGLIYARTDIGSVYRWQAKEQRWHPLTDFHSPQDYNLNGPESVALDPNDPNRLYIAAGMYAYSNCCAFLVSRDRGATFKTYPAPFEMAANSDGRAAGERLAVNPFKPNELFMGTRFNGLWVSEDHAETWKQVSSFPVQSSTDTYGVQSVLFDPKTPGTIYVGSYTNATVYVSTNDGATWAALPGQPIAWPFSVRSGTNPPAPERALINRDGDLYVNFNDLPGPNVINYGIVEKYNPSTKAWTNITPPPDSPFQSGPLGGFVGLSQDPTRAGTVAVSTMDRWYPVDTVYVTHDSGSTWINLGLITSSSGDDGPPFGSYYFNPSVYTSTSPYLTFGGTNFPNSPDLSAKFGWWISALLIDPSNPDHLMYGTGATIYGTNNVSAADVGGPPTWSVQAKGVEETAVLALISPSAGAHLLSGVGDIGGFQHTDFNVSPAAGMYTNPVATSVGSLDWAGQNPGFIVRAQSPATSSTSPCNYGAFSTNNGTSWTPFTACAQGANSGNGGTISADASGTTIMWTPPFSGTAQFSTDNGETWISTVGLPGPTAVYADKVKPQLFYSYSSTSSGGAFYSGTVDTVHGTATFSQVNTTPLPASASCNGSGCGVVDVNFARHGDLWLPLGSNGLYHSTDGGITWTKRTNVTYANSVAVGAASPWTHQQAVFLYGQTSPHGTMAVYRSDDSGKSWVRINDDEHQYGGPTLIQADPRIYGRVYLGMNGRGIIYGDLRRLDNRDWRQ
jgi:oligoxyloglucan reducing-end-specific cellobiohydrolase